MVAIVLFLRLKSQSFMDPLSSCFCENMSGDCWLHRRQSTGVEMVVKLIKWVLKWKRINSKISMPISTYS